MKALVTGGGGFLGLYITEQLLARGDQVRVLTRNRHEEIARLGVEWIPGDVRDLDACRRASLGTDTVFHVAAVPGIWGPWSLFHSINTLGTENVIQACREAGVARLVYTSSPSVIYDGLPHENVNESYPYPDKYLCHYPHSKALAEQAVLAANGGDGLATVALRPHLIWGPRDNHLIPRLIRRAKSGRLRQVGDGTNLISVSYVENTAAAHLAAADALGRESNNVAGRAYFINEPEPVNLWGFINDLLNRAGLPPIHKKISARGAKAIGHLLEVVYGTLRIRSEPPMTRFLASQLCSSHYYNVSAAEQDFGFRSVVPFARGLERVTPELQRLARS